jgi:peptide/nickel transport system substrate-binding protein
MVSLFRTPKEGSMGHQEKQGWQRLLRRSLTRRQFLRAGALGTAALAGSAYLACGEESVPSTPAVGAPGAETPWLGGLLRFALSDVQGRFDAHRFPTFTVQTFNSFFVSRLLKHISGPDDPNTEELDLPPSEWYRPVPDLAKSYEVVDQLTYIFTLQDNATWHPVPPVNGRPVTPDDVVKAWEYYKSARPDRGVNLAAIDSITVAGPRQVRVKLSRPFGPLLVMLASPSDFWIYPPEATNNPDLLNTTLIGSGPFILRSYQQGVMAKAEKNPNWWATDDRGNRLPYVDGFEAYVIPDKNNEISQFSAGRLETMTVPAELIDVFRRQNPQAIITKNIANLLTIIFFPPAAYEANQPPFNDPRVRQAVSLAIDREALIQLASGGKGGKKHNLLNAGFIWYVDPEGPEMGELGQFFRRDVQRARQLLAAAGYPDGFDTELHYTANAYVTAVPYYNPMAEALPAMLREAGIRARLVNHDYQSEWINPQGGIFFGGLRSGMAFALETPVPHPWNQFTNQFTDNPRNHSRIRDPEILRLIEQLGQETDFDRGRALALEIQRINARNMYYIPLVGPYGFGARQPYTRAYAAPTSYGIGSESTPYFQIDTSRQRL